LECTVQYVHVLVYGCIEPLFSDFALKPIKIHEREQRHGPSSHKVSYERDTGRSIEIHVAFVDHVISQSSSSALANYEA